MAGDEKGAIIERGVRLSASSLWKFQRQFYDQRGVRAWSERVVPTHVTSNAYIAQAYAQLAMRFMQDLATQPADSAFALDPEQPVYIVELGSGSGYFAYLFLNKLVEQQRRSGFNAPRVCYVATDFTANNVDTWKKHPCFQPFAEYGLFDCARFDAEEDGELELEISGVTLRPGAMANPMILLANYLFDTIYADVYRVEKGVLEEGLALLRKVEPADGTTGKDDNPLDHIAVEFEYQPVTGPAYDDPLLDQILAEYADTLGNTAFTFPVSALRCIKHFERLSGGRLLLVSGDKGHGRLADLTGLPDPAVVHHGSISMMVNYHAIGRYLETSQGGFLLATTERESSLEIVVGSTAALASLPETETAFYDAVDRFGPLDAYHIAGIKLSEPDFDQVLALLRMAAYDPITFTWLGPELHGTLRDPSSSQVARLLRALGEVWRLHYPLPGGRDVPFDLGFTCYLVSRWNEALYFYEQSVALHGAHHVTLYNMGLCHYRMGQVVRALDCFDRSLALDGSYGPARDWKVRVSAELGEPPILSQLPPAEPAEPPPEAAEPAEIRD